MSTLLIAEHNTIKLQSNNYHTLTAAHSMGNPVDMLIMGHLCEAIVNEAKTIPGIRRLWVADHVVYEHQLPENGAQLIAELGRDYDAILCSASTFGKNMLPRVAALLGVSMVSDVIQIISPNTFVRPIYAGNALATVQTQDKISIITVRSTAFAPISRENESEPATIEMMDRVIPNTLSEFVSQELTASSRPELTSARIVVSGGRGLKSKENFKLLEKLADQLGAAVGASRAAVDAGFAPNDYQVGQTGKVVAPDLYLAIGISGAIQHLAGMKDSKTIVAINNDPDAPIFQVADYGLVADLFDALKELQTELSQ